MSIVEPGPSPQPNRFRWRIIPGWFFLIFGGFLAIGNALYLALWLFLVFRGYERPSATTLGGIYLSASAGIVWFLAGRAFFAGQWKSALLAVLIGYGLGALGSYLVMELPRKKARQAVFSKRRIVRVEGHRLKKAEATQC